ncbi:methyl-accepting chemotaxis protein [Bradyrhizobium sp. USDA 3686]|nr:methyl-accepting chemotaxis protein [Bradyrhizobium canariense]
MSFFSLRLSHKILMVGLVGLLGLAIFGGIYLTGAASQEASRKVAEEARLLSNLNEKLARDMLDARRAEKDFLLRRDEASMKRHAAVSAMITAEMDRLGTMIRASGFSGLSEKVDSLAKGFNDYQKQFAALEQTEIRLGLNEKLGLSGSLRGSVHDIEARLKDTNSQSLTSGMLMMRRHEKDFMLRRDPSYVESFQKSADDFAKTVAASDLVTAVKTDIAAKLRSYRNDFASWAEAAQRAKIEASAMSKEYANIEPIFESIEQDVRQRHDEAQAREADTLAAVRRWMLIALVLAIVVVSAISLTIARSVTKAIASMVQAMVRLARGDMTVAVPGTGRHDEIGEMAGAVDVFKTNMIEAERLRAEQVEVEKRQAEQRKTDMHRLAGEFEAAVGEIVDTVSSASTELEASAGTLTRTAEHAQQLATTVASASEEASTNVQSVASATEELSSSVTEISRQVQASARMASQAVDQARTTTEKVGALSKAAARIGDVVDLINTIAGQTICWLLMPPLKLRARARQAVGLR